MTDPPDHLQIRAGDRDRDRVAETLRHAVGEGRITIEELHERLGRTYAARTFGELDAIVADLPRPGALPAPLPGSPDGLPVPLPDSPDVLRLHTRSGRVKRLGHWVVPPRISVRCGVWGTVKMDFMRAECPHREVSVELEVTSWFGDVIVVVPHGWRIRADEVLTTGMGTVHNKPAGPPAPDAVTLRFSGETKGDIWVRYRYRRG
ncbi:DUF1707 SHOCT-like domain-containing protein [Planobispora rosea]|uniref:DUF1707 SHOCT-like domain-containing protein n=1 Tax=Planobispora rosea TaxID=35762 RepID=UPI000839DD33|nr:DUF1707 domain-containing protein [Planobispora rosea]